MSKNIIFMFLMERLELLLKPGRLIFMAAVCCYYYTCISFTHQSNLYFHQAKAPAPMSPSSLRMSLTSALRTPPVEGPDMSKAGKDADNEQSTVVGSIAVPCFIYHPLHLLVTESSL